MCLCVSLPNWIATGLVGGADQYLAYTSSVGLLSYTMGSTLMASVPGVATLVVDHSAGIEVTVWRCYRCRLVTVTPTDSNQACVREFGELQ